jgi:hypothetical protein
MHADVLRIVRMLDCLFLLDRPSRSRLRAQRDLGIRVFHMGVLYVSHQSRVTILNEWEKPVVRSMYQLARD